MPRDLFHPSKDEESPLTLTRSPESQSSAAGPESHNELDDPREASLYTNFQFRRGGRINKEIDELHPYVQTLTIADLQSCVSLENVAFPEHERCSPEKVRLLEFAVGEIEQGLCLGGDIDTGDIATQFVLHFPSITTDA